ncbi:MAG: SPOR domain-containing protein [Gammaproteobacteria bacterium]
MRERLIGAIVLIVIAVILIPWLIAHSHNPGVRAARFNAPPALSTGAAALPKASTTAGGQTTTLQMTPARPAASAARVAPQSAQRTAVAPRSAAGALRAGTPPVMAPSPAPSTVSSGPESRPESRPAPRNTATSQSAVAPTGVGGNTAKREQGIGKGDWYVQVGSFASRDNAAQLAIELTRSGYRVFFKGYETGDKTVYRVRVGPYPSEARANAVAPGLSALSGSQVLVRQADGSGG